ncbi:MAG: adenylate/guanylate cyclase domain-containing response regulator [Spirochaetota bacterium]
MSIQKSKVLIIEDSLPEAMLLNRWLKKSYDVQLCHDGNSALTCLQDFTADILLININLPDMTGFQLLETIREQKKCENSIMVAISGDISEKLHQQFLVYGFSDFIRKPYLKIDLLLRLQNHSKNLRREAELLLLQQKSEKEKTLLAKYFSDDIVENILNETITTNLGGENLEVTVLFFDIRNSTKLSTQMPALDFADFLSLLLTDVMDLIYGNAGSVNKLIGDGLMATFGCPKPSAADASNAVLCAQSIIEHLELFNEFRPEKIQDPIQVGIGIASGNVFAGNIGSVRRMEYTVIGDAANLASRLESLTKHTGIPILIDKNTKERDTSQQFTYVKTNIENVKGISQVLDIYSIEMNKQVLQA